MPIFYDLSKCCIAIRYPGNIEFVLRKILHATATDPGLIEEYGVSLKSFSVKWRETTWMGKLSGKCCAAAYISFDMWLLQIYRS